MTTTTTPLELMSLPVELHLAIHAHLPLPALLAARAVCTSWHALIPGTHLPPARRRLLSLYLRAVRSPAFQATRARTAKSLEPFDRHQLVATLRKGNHAHALPEEFEMWLTEWPAKAAFGGLWPGQCTDVLPTNDTEKEASVEEESLLKPLGKSLFSARRPPIFNQLELSPVDENDERTDSDMHVAPSWVPVAPAKRAVTLLLDDATVNGWQRSKMVVLSAPATHNITGAVYEIDGVKGRADRPLARGWTEFLEKELDREERWLAAHPPIPVLASVLVSVVFLPGCGEHSRLTRFP